MNEKQRSTITGVVLAGGRGRRMGGEDKGWMEFRGRPLILIAREALKEACGPLLISANRNLDRYRALGNPVIVDRTDSFDGPLAGLLSAMEAAETEFVLTIPCDSPFVDGKLLRRLYEKLEEAGADVCVAFDGERMQSVFLISRRSLAPDLSNYLKSGQRKADVWLKAQKLAIVDFSGHPEMFVNLNTREDLENWEASWEPSAGSNPLKD